MKIKGLSREKKKLKLRLPKEDPTYQDKKVKEKRHKNRREQEQQDSLIMQG